ncbi:HEAT repeat domain-containing protein [Clostridium sp. DJ247]|uniref:HEAT repeat domain-containing protein n=1 Tax=Clostridium sp. DJ247 TaxID=2726188 RepID=UPI00162371EC|nr:HEAT repeat domain-containing protein [Clostridium sp. DJ247]MBC2582911.1 HEAT repeat domain-containing protein [Clostridium sp. DJ247]
MKYKVYNENNVQVTVTDEQLNEALERNGKELPIELIIAMGASHDKKYIPRLNEALYHQEQRVRIEAVYSLLSINDIESIRMLQEKEKSFSEVNFNVQISEKAILQSVIIRLEYGPNGAENAFFNGDYPPIVKSGLLYNYSSNIVLTPQDVIFIINSLESYVNKSESWIKTMNKDDYEDVIIKCLEGLLRAAEESVILNTLTDDLNRKLAEVGARILKMKIDSYAKEVIATFAKALPPKYAYDLLEPIMNGRVRGDVRKELENSIQILRQKEME